jgi:hypothetical protein
LEECYQGYNEYNTFAMADLFSELFGGYGHVSCFPRFKKDAGTYEWNLSVYLDMSFSFLLQDKVSFWKNSTRDELYSYLSGLLDADGSIVVTRDSGVKVTLFLDYCNSDIEFLNMIRSFLINEGYLCSIRINKRAGFKTQKYHIIHRRDYWQLSVYGIDRVKKLIRKLEPRHREKIFRKKPALSVEKGDLYETFMDVIQSFKEKLQEEIREFAEQCEREYKAKHGITMKDLHSPNE